MTDYRHPVRHTLLLYLLKTSCGQSEDSHGVHPVAKAVGFVEDGEWGIDDDPAATRTYSGPPTNPDVTVPYSKFNDRIFWFI